MKYLIYVSFSRLPDDFNSLTDKTNAQIINITDLINELELNENNYRLIAYIARSVLFDYYLIGQLYGKIDTKYYNLYALDKNNNYFNLIGSY